MIITPKTTDAYVGETIPLRIEFYIRMDVHRATGLAAHDQGKRFSHEHLSVRPAEDVLALMNESYHRETWITAISAPKSGDFPLQHGARHLLDERSPNNVFRSAWQFLQRPIQPGPRQCRQQQSDHPRPFPARRRNARPISPARSANSRSTGNARPSSVDVGEPVTSDFNVSGEGNFDYVRCPALAADPAWKSLHALLPDSLRGRIAHPGRQDFRPGGHSREKNGNLPLPAASFSYFDPTAKKYVTIPIPLPTISVTGTPLPAPVLAASGPAAAASAPTSSSSNLAPNRLEPGVLRAGLEPAYRQPWFWFSQGGFFSSVADHGRSFSPNALPARPPARRIASCAGARSPSWKPP